MGELLDFYTDLIMLSPLNQINIGYLKHPCTCLALATLQWSSFIKLATIRTRTAEIKVSLRKVTTFCIVEGHQT